MAAKKPKDAEREAVGSGNILNHWNCSACPYWSQDPDEVDAHIALGEHLPEPGTVPVAEKSLASHPVLTREEVDAAHADTEES